ncbi:MAG: hypothetical protein AAB848_02035 [Patescibacteria group bacterium]
MNKYLKFIQKLSVKDREKVLEIWRRIINSDLEKLNVKKLSGFQNYYRVRAGKIRFVFKMENSRNILINIDYRKDAYRNL